MVCHDRTIFLPRYNYLRIWNLRVQTNLKIEKIAFKVVQIMFLTMHITNQKLSFDIFTVVNLQTSSWNMIFTLYPNDLWYKIVFTVQTVYLWLLPQIYLSDLRLVLWSRVTYRPQPRSQVSCVFFEVFALFFMVRCDLLR